MAFTHDENPLSADEWARLNAAVIDAAKRVLVGRRVIDIHGPIGPGMEAIVHDHITGAGIGRIGLLGEEESARVHSIRREPGFIPLIYKDFVLHWRDIETARLSNVPIDVSIATGASALCAAREDELIFHGESTLGYEGLMTIPGRLRLQKGDWEASGHAFSDVARATELLIEKGFYGPYAMVVSPRLYALMHRVHRGTNVLEIEHIRKLVTDGLHQSPVLRGETGVIFSSSRANLDLVVGQDLSVGFLGAESMNYPFRVFEAVYMRVKRPRAICTLE
jgi:uncharacterized linocin/CFP29 family protein